MNWGILGIVWLIWAVFITRLFYKIIYKEYSYCRTIDSKLPENFKPFQRVDRSRWVVAELFLGAVTLLPIRLILLLLTMFNLEFWVFVLRIHKKYDKERSPLLKYITDLIGIIATKSIIFCTGFWKVTTIKKKISEYDSDYPEHLYKDREQKAHILVSNHVSWIETMYYCSVKECPSFLAKSVIKNYPLFGSGTKVMQCIFVERENQEQKDTVLHQLLERCEKIIQKKRFSPVMIFPEGTVSNGQQLLSFKKGAFQPFAPIKIYALSYDGCRYNPYFDFVSILFNCFLLMSQFSNKMTVYEFDVYFPDHLNLKDRENDWQLYAKKIKSIMAKCLKVPETEYGFRDYKDYLNFLKINKKAKVD